MLNYYIRLIIRSTLVLGIIILFFNIISKFLLTLYYLKYEEVEDVEEVEEVEEDKDVEEGEERAKINNRYS